MALVNSSVELAWIVALLKELKTPTTRAPIIWCDNNGAISLAINLVYHGRTEHIEIDMHFIREKVKKKDLEVRYVPTQEQLADMMTKPLSGHFFKYMVNKLSIS